MRIIGIDPGLSGGIAILDDLKIYDIFDMPIMSEGKKNKNQLKIADKFNEIRKIIERLHNYETPEIISLEILEGNEKYLKWIQDEID